MVLACELLKSTVVCSDRFATHDSLEGRAIGNAIQGFAALELSL